MRIGVDATSWANGRGYGRFTREVLRAMAELLAEEGGRGGAAEVGARAGGDRGPDELVLFVEADGAGAIDLAGERVRVRPVELAEAPSRAASATGRRRVRDMLRLARAVRAERLDVFFSPTVYTWFPLPPGLRACVGIHDATPERFPGLTFGTRRARLLWRAKVRLALLQARIVLTVSEHARRDLARVLGIAPRRLRVATEAPAPVFRPSDDDGEVAAAAERAGLPPGARWIVYVGGFNPHKNVDVLVRAHARVAADEPDLHLLLVGTLDGDVFHGAAAEVREEIRRRRTGSRVHWCGFVPDAELRHLYSGAVAACLPSACEGFGLPAVEAAACGAPAVATTESPLPEILEGGGIFVAPGDEDALADAIGRLAADEDLRRRLARGALGRAGALSWPRTARAALDAVRAAAGLPPRWTPGTPGSEEAAA